MQALIIALAEDHLVKWKNIDPNDPSKGKIQDYWEHAKKYILNNKLIKRIQSYKEDKIRNMNPKGIDKLKKICVSLKFRKIPTLKRKKFSKSQNPRATCRFGFGLALKLSVLFWLSILRDKNYNKPKISYFNQKWNFKNHKKICKKVTNIISVLDLLKSLEDNYQKAIEEKEALE